MPSTSRDWFAGFQPIVSETRATRATRATPAEKGRNTWVPDAAAMLPDQGNTRATEGNTPDPVAHVAHRMPSEGNTELTQKSEENREFPLPVAHVAHVAFEKEAGTEWTEEYEERTAIVADGSGCPVEWAAGFARLDPVRPPAGISARRWLTFVDDCGRFIDTWAQRAAELGWSPLDLFGADRDRPLARVDRSGLLWLTDGDRIVALTGQTAAIQTRTGARLTYRRRPADDNAVVAWDLAQ